MLTAKILKANGQDVYRSTLQHLTDKELDSPIHIKMICIYDKSIERCLGPGATEADFPDKDLTPEYPHYDDYGIGPVAIENVMPEAGDNYVNAEIMLP